MCWVLNANLAAVLVPSKHILFENSTAGQTVKHSVHCNQTVKHRRSCAMISTLFYIRVSWLCIGVLCSVVQIAVI